MSGKHFPEVHVVVMSRNHFPDELVYYYRRDYVKLGVTPAS